MLGTTAKHYALSKGKLSDLAMVLVTYVDIPVSMYHLHYICSTHLYPGYTLYEDKLSQEQPSGVVLSHKLQCIALANTQGFCFSFSIHHFSKHVRFFGFYFFNISIQQTWKVTFYVASMGMLYICHYTHLYGSDTLKVPYQCNCRSWKLSKFPDFSLPQSFIFPDHTG